MKVGDLVLIGAVVIHDPDFLDACATGANESDLRGGDAGQAARKFADDFVCKLMREFANLQVGGTAAIDLADHGLRRGVAHVKEPGLDGDFGSGFGQITEAEIVGVGWRLHPRRSF